MAEVLRISIKGSMPNGEEWSVNPVWRIGGPSGTPVTPAQAQSAATAIAAIVVPTGLLNLMAAETKVTGVRFEARSMAGILETQAEAVKATPTPGGGSGLHPYQTSLVFSLRSGTPGASGRGRLYWPATGALLNNTDLRVAAADVTSGISAMKTYLTSIEAALMTAMGGAVGLIVWSRIGVGARYDVTSILVGNIADVQRRRRDVLVENYTSTSYP